MKVLIKRQAIACRHGMRHQGSFMTRPTSHSDVTGIKRCGEPHIGLLIRQIGDEYLVNYDNNEYICDRHELQFLD